MDTPSHYNHKVLDGSTNTCIMARMKTKYIKNDLLAGVEALVTHLYQDYANWINLCNSSKDIKDKMIAETSFHVNTDGRNYWRVEKWDGSQRCSIGFVVAKPTKGFQSGDLLKSASWKAPATNFIRGSVLTRDFSQCSWAGIG